MVSRIYVKYVTAETVRRIIYMLYKILAKTEVKDTLFSVYQALGDAIKLYRQRRETEADTYYQSAISSLIAVKDVLQAFSSKDTTNFFELMQLIITDLELLLEDIYENREDVFYRWFELLYALGTLSATLRLMLNEYKIPVLRKTGFKIIYAISRNKTISKTIIKYYITTIKKSIGETILKNYFDANNFRYALRLYNNVIRLIYYLRGLLRRYYRIRMHTKELVMRLIQRRLVYYEKLISNYLDAIAYEYSNKVRILLNNLLRYDKRLFEQLAKEIIDPWGILASILGRLATLGRFISIANEFLSQPIVQLGILGTWFMVDNLPFYIHMWKEARGETFDAIEQRIKTYIMGVRDALYVATYSAKQKDAIHTEAFLSFADLFLRKIEEELEKYKDTLEKRGTYEVYKNLVEMLKYRIQYLRDLIAKGGSPDEVKAYVRSIKYDLERLRHLAYENVRKKYKQRYIPYRSREYLLKIESLERKIKRELEYLEKKYESYNKYILRRYGYMVKRNIEILNKKKLEELREAFERLFRFLAYYYKRYDTLRDDIEAVLRMTLSKLLDRFGKHKDVIMNELIRYFKEAYVRK